MARMQINFRGAFEIVVKHHHPARVAWWFSDDGLNDIPLTGAERERICAEATEAVQSGLGAGATPTAENTNIASSGHETAADGMSDDEAAAQMMLDSDGGDLNEDSLVQVMRMMACQTPDVYFVQSQQSGLKIMPAAVRHYGSYEAAMDAAKKILKLERE